jgi:hypothetical protein
MKVLFFICSTIAIVFALSCAPKQKGKPDVFLIFVEELGFNEVNCLQRSTLEAEVHLNPEDSGFEAFCEDSVRFTHAFTSSTFSPASIASVFTAKYPYQHGLRTFKDTLKREWNTLPETAREAGFATAFFSGGAPVFRHTGLHQGFDFFDDNSRSGELFVPFEKNIERIQTWIQEEQDSRLFLSVYVPDLRYKSRPTFTNLGEPRNISFRSQLSELDESLKKFIDLLKKQGRWDHSYVFLIGLNGSMESIRNAEPARLGLLTEHVQISLFAKAPQKPRDTGLAWSVDENISSLDIGQTLFSIINPQSAEAESISESSEAISFLDSLQGPKSSVPRGRMILIENPWLEILFNKDFYFAIRRDNLVYLHEDEPRIYNSLADRFEMNAVDSQEEPYKSFESEAKAHLQTIASPVNLNSIELKAKLEAFEDFKSELSSFVKCESLPEQFPSLVKGISSLASERSTQMDCLQRNSCSPVDGAFSRKLQRAEASAEISQKERSELARYYRWQLQDRAAQMMNFKYDFSLLPFAPQRLATDLDRLLGHSTSPSFAIDMHKTLCLELKTDWSL